MPRRRKLYFYRIASSAIQAARDPDYSYPDEDARTLLKHIESMYATHGPATHIAYPEHTGEVVVAYPRRERDGYRFVAVAAPYVNDGYSKNIAGYADEVAEFELEYTDEQLENGIPAHLSLV